MGYKHDVIGNVEDEEFFWVIKKYVPFLNQEIKLMFDKEEEDGYITENQVKTYLEIMKLSRDVLDDSTKGVYENYIEIRNMVEPAPSKISSPNNVWKHIRFEDILIPRLKSSKNTFFFLEMECDWEEEHGLEILYKNCCSILIGQQDGLSCSAEWDDYIK